VNIGHSPNPVQPPLASRVRNQVGHCHGTFTKAAFYSEPPLPCPRDPRGELAVRYANISPRLSLVVGGCGNLLRVKTPVQSSPVLISGRATVGGTYRKMYGKLKYAARTPARDLQLPYSVKVRCRGLHPRLNHSAEIHGRLQGLS